MVSAKLTKEYITPMYLQPAPKFTRGFARLDDLTEYLPQTDHKTDGMVFAIQHYSKAMRPRAAKPQAQGLLQ